jgi:hypothetical protein
MKLLRSLCIIIVATLVMAELCFRLLSLFPVDSGLYRNDPDVGFRMRPNIEVRGESTNSFGFKDVEHVREKRSHVHRAAFIGDSFVFGVVPRRGNFVFRFGELARKEGRAVEVLNMGIPAAGPENYLALIERDASDMSVDTVCVVFFVGNDIVQSHPDFTTKVWLGATRETLRNAFAVGFSPEYFYLFRAGRSLGRLVADRMHGEPGKAFSEKTYLSIERQRAEIFKRNQSSFLKECYLGAEDLLLKMAEQTRRRGVGFFVVLAPDEIQVNGRLREKVLGHYGLNPEEYDFEQAQRILVDSLRKRNVPVLDLLGPFVANSDKVLYEERDTHWNLDGNELAAERIWEFFSARFSRGVFNPVGGDEGPPGKEQSENLGHDYE